MGGEGEGLEVSSRVHMEAGGIQKRTESSLFVEGEKRTRWSKDLSSNEVRDGDSSRGLLNVSSYPRSIQKQN